MSDRFLFRAWDIDRKKMIWGNCNLMLNMNGNKYWDFGYEKPQYLQDQDKFILMQSTGLRDKNGKLIFEGDILTVNKYGTPVYYQKVTWDEEVASFVLNRSEFNYCNLDGLEIIGNIYENSHLIEDKA